MKSVSDIRQRMAEAGYEFTPKQIAWVVNKIRKLHNRLSKESDSFFELPLETRQEIRQLFAEMGQEITIDEVDGYIKLADKIRKLEM